MASLIHTFILQQSPSCADFYLVGKWWNDPVLVLDPYYNFIAGCGNCTTGTNALNFNVVCVCFYTAESVSL